MEGWIQTAVEVTSAAVGFVAVVVVLLLFLRSRRRRIQIARQQLIDEQEWQPIRSAFLAQDLTKAIPAQTQIMNSGNDNHHLRGLVGRSCRKYSSLDPSSTESSPISTTPKKQQRSLFHRSSAQPLSFDTGSRDDPLYKNVQKSGGVAKIRAKSNDYKILRSGQSLPSLLNESSGLIDQQQLLDHSDSETPLYTDLLKVPGAGEPELKACSTEELYLTPDLLPEEWSGTSSHPTIEFSITHVSKSKSLVVQVTRLVNVSLRNRSSASLVIKVKLTKQATPSTPTGKTSDRSSTISGSPSSGTLSGNVHLPLSGVDAQGHAICQTPCSLKKPFDPENGTYFTFTGFTCSELRDFHLWIFLYHCKIKILREILLGEVTYSMAQLELSSRFPLRCIEKIQFPSKKRHTDALFKDLAPEDGGNGQLMLTLFYQALANRMKVLVRKAERLPRKKKVLAQPGYYVIVNTMCCGKIVISQETKSVHGRSPVWNHPFIFDIPENDLNKYSMQFIVMFGKSSHHQGVAGQVVIGPDVRDSGRAHWLEAFQPRSTESARWHKLQPM